MDANQFVHLHVHSEYSLLDGAGRIDRLVQAAKRQGMSALALTDHGVMYGVIPFYQACKQAGLKPIIGLEAYVTNKPLDEKLKRGEPHLYHLTLLAENEAGYQNLMRLTTKAHLEGFYYKPRITKEWLREHAEGIICLSGCLSGELAQALLDGDGQRAREIAIEHREIFGADNYFFELADHGLMDERKVNARLIRLSKELDIPLVVTNDVHYIQARDAVAHDCLLCIGTGRKIDDEARLKFPNAEFYLKSGEEMAALFPHLPDAYRNTVRIAERCSVNLTFGQEILPAYPVPKGMSALQYLRQLCEEGLRSRYPHVSDHIQKRLEYELTIIGQMGYADYFLIVWDLVRFAHERGILVGPGRGSAAGSLVAYVLKITDVDPIKYNLLFERFLNPERISRPDIDIDFSDQRRDEVLQYAAEKYGRDRVAQIITFGTLGARAAVRDVGRVLDFPIRLVDRVAKCIPSGPGATLERALNQSDELKELIQQDERVERLLSTARELEGLARHTSIHAAGIVISEEPLPHYVPLEEGHSGLPLTQYPMEALESLGLLKMDLLGLRNLTLLEEILRIINEDRADDDTLQLQEIPFDDQATYELLSAGDTAGVFQLESTGMRQVLKRLKPTRFEDVIAVLALYRPGPMDHIPLFIKAKHGETEIHFPHPDLKPILEETYGIIVYQEQIMQIAATMAGFTLGEADLLRRAVSKKDRALLEQERERFVDGALAQGYEREVAEHVYNLIVRFADYGFNRSHSAAYAVIAYQLAYLKTHYPVAFLASLISMHIDSTEKVALYLEQAAKRNVKVLPPSIHRSEEKVTVEGDKIRLGLGVIKNVGHSIVREIKRARSEGPFKNMLDFCQRVDLRIVNRRVLESLVLAGALDELGMHRAQALANLDELLEMAEQAQGIRESDQLFFFADELPDDYEWPDAPRFTYQERLKYEKEALGFYLSGHPLDVYRDRARAHGAHFISELSGQGDDTQVRTIGYLSRVKRITTKKGDAMAFVQLEDQGSQLEAVVFPKVYAQHPTLYQEEQLLFVEGRLATRDGERQLVISRAMDLARLPQLKKLYIKVTAEQERKQLKQIKAILVNHPGRSPVFLYYERLKQLIRLGERYHVNLNKELLDRLTELVGSHSHIKVTTGEAEQGERTELI